MSNKSAIVMLKEVSQHLTQRRDNIYKEMTETLTQPIGIMMIVDRRIKVVEYVKVQEDIKEIGKCILKLRGDKWSI